MDINPSDGGYLLPQGPNLNIENLEAIDGAMQRLNSLGIAIRQSSVTSQATKARKFTEKFDLTSFEEVSYLALTSLYPGANEELLEQLSRSMRDTYSLFLFRKSRQESLQIHRANPVGLSTIREEPTSDASIGDSMDFEMQNPQPQVTSAIGMNRRTVQQPRLQQWLHSEPTSLNSKKVHSKLNQQHEGGSSKSKTLSILVNQADYPRPPKGTLACEWCFQPIPKEGLEGDKWEYGYNPSHFDRPESF